MGSQQYSLRWNNYLRHITCAFDSLRSDKDLVDVTLSCDGRKVQAHKMLLSACSSYFRDLFKENPCQHPVVIFRNVRFDDLLALVDFMYQGEVNVEQDQLASFLNTAELLQVQGLTNADGNKQQKEDVDVPPTPEVQFGGNRSPDTPQYPSEDSSQLSASGSTSGPAAKRRKWRTRSSSPVSVTPVNTNVEGQTDSSRRSCSPPIDVLPMKMEAPDYEERLEEAAVSGDEATDSTLARLRDNQELMLTKSSDTFKMEQVYPRDLNPVDILATGNIEGDAMAGPSNDLLSQDALSGYHKLPPAQLIPLQLKPTTCVKNLIVQGGLGDTFMCKVCGRAFKDRKSCHRHMSMHLGTSTCPICFSILSRVSHLKRHMKNVHGI